MLPGRVPAEYHLGRSVMALKIVELINIVLAALVAGVFWGPWVALTRSIATFDTETFLAIGYRLNLNLAPLMTVLMPLSLLSTATTLVLSYGDRPGTFYASLAGLVLFVVALAVTMTIEVPIANKVKSWSSSPLPDNWRQLRDRWASVHLIRVVTGIAGLALFVFGVIYY
jgi:uncharacterized membrane protein